MNIFILTTYSQSLKSVEVISNDIINIYLSLQNVDLSVKVYDVDDKNFLSTDFDCVEKNIFISVHPGVLRSPGLLKITQMMKTKDKLIIHVYGDFVRQASFFNETQKYLQGKQVLFLPPSKTYGNLLEKLIKNNKSIIPTPFPVDLEKFNFNNSLKKAHSITSEIVLVYGGRISRQKNIEQLLEWFNSLDPVNNYKLFIIGKFDDFEVGNIGNNFKLGELYQRLQRYKSRAITFIDHLPHEELYSYYRMADYFVSFSTYHDEDFGRAPIESILCGTPCLLSDWGGYRDLIEEFPEFVQAAKISLKSNGLEITPSPELKLEKKSFFGDIEKLKSKYSRDTFRLAMLNLISADFPIYTGITELMSNLAINNRSFFYEKDGELKIENYKKLYRDFGTEI